MIDKDKILTLTTYIDKADCYYYLGRWIRHKYIVSDFGECEDARISINKARSVLQEIAKNTTDFEFDYVLLLDPEILTTDEGLDALVEQYDGNPICANIDDIYTIHNDHDVPNCACCLLDKETYFNINYLENPEECQCYKIPNARYAEDVYFTKGDFTGIGTNEYLCCDDNFTVIHNYDPSRHDNPNDEEEYIITSGEPIDINN